MSDESPRWATIDAALDERDALRAELSALKARPTLTGEQMVEGAMSYVHDALVQIAAALDVRTASEYEEGEDAPNFKLVERILAAASEASALKARRCDGCAHSAPKWRYYPNDGLRCAHIHADVNPEFSCAAWTPKEPQP